LNMEALPVNRLGLPEVCRKRRGKRGNAELRGSDILTARPINVHTRDHEHE
jgi:hypothetical protein